MVISCCIRCLCLIELGSRTRHISNDFFGGVFAGTYFYGYPDCLAYPDLVLMAFF